MSPLIVVVGPTAVGKTALSLDIARRYSGEIICADSRTLYRGLDIGTAKPTQAEQTEISHHLLDIAQPDEFVGAARFQMLANQAISEILARGRVPIMVGGCGLYIDSVLYGYEFGAVPKDGLRADLSLLSLPELLERLERLDAQAAQMVDRANPRRVMRAIEIAGQPKPKRGALRPYTLILGLTLSKEAIQSRIRQRIDAMLEAGFVGEVAKMSALYGWEAPALSGIGYQAFRGVLEGTMSISEGAHRFARGDYQLARRQLTWFKRNPDIRWVLDAGEALSWVGEFLGAV
jgi:tRNA dimethylallyltransferase